jgi:hypothetical protein
MEYSKEELYESLINRAAEVSPKLFELIAEAMRFIPPDIQDSVLYNITFRTPNTYTEKEYILPGGIICLEEDLPSKKSAIETVLHEIAHFYLGHNITDINVNNWMLREEEADTLVKKWTKSR